MLDGIALWERRARGRFEETGYAQHADVDAEKDAERKDNHQARNRVLFPHRFALSSCTFQVFIGTLFMASKLDTLLKQLLEIRLTLTDDKTKRIIDTIEEIVKYIQTIQEECIKLLQERTVDDRTVPQPPFRWDSLRNDRSPFKAPFGPFSD